MSTKSSFKGIDDVYRGKDCMKKFCESLREHVIKIINFLKMSLFTKDQQESYENAKISHICKEKLENIWKTKNIVKLEIIAIIQGNIEVLQLANVIWNIVHLKIVFHNGSNCDYHFIIQELVEKFTKQFTCLGENTEKCINFTVSIEKEVTRIDKMDKKL